MKNDIPSSNEWPDDSTTVPAPLVSTWVAIGGNIDLTPPITAIEGGNTLEPGLDEPNINIDPSLDVPDLVDTTSKPYVIKEEDLHNPQTDDFILPETEPDLVDITEEEPTFIEPNPLDLLNLDTAQPPNSKKIGKDSSKVMLPIAPTILPVTGSEIDSSSNFQKLLDQIKDKFKGKTVQTPKKYPQSQASTGSIPTLKVPIFAPLGSVTKPFQKNILVSWPVIGGGFTIGGVLVYSAYSKPANTEIKPINLSRLPTTQVSLIARDVPPIATIDGGLPSINLPNIVIGELSPHIAFIPAAMTLLAVGLQLMLGKQKPDQKKRNYLLGLLTLFFSVSSSIAILNMHNAKLPLTHPITFNPESNRDIFKDNLILANQLRQYKMYSEFSQMVIYLERMSGVEISLTPSTDTLMKQKILSLESEEQARSYIIGLRKMAPYLKLLKVSKTPVRKVYLVGIISGKNRMKEEDMVGGFNGVSIDGSVTLGLNLVSYKKNTGSYSHELLAHSIQARSDKTHPFLVPFFLRHRGGSEGEYSILAKNFNPFDISPNSKSPFKDSQILGKSVGRLTPEELRKAGVFSEKVATYDFGASFNKFSEDGDEVSAIGAEQIGLVDSSIKNKESITALLGIWSHHSDLFAKDGIIGLFQQIRNLDNLDDSFIQEEVDRIMKRIDILTKSTVYDKDIIRSRDQFRDLMKMIDEKRNEGSTSIIIIMLGMYLQYTTLQLFGLFPKGSKKNS